jgi:DNA mismatch repair protein MutS
MTSLAFYSILFETADDRIGDDTLEAPAFFVDLNCDQIVAAVTAGKDEYNLKLFFHACLLRIEAIEYRHEVMQDLENPSLHERVNDFAQNMRDMREHLGRVQKAHYKEQKQAWFLDGVAIYCQAVILFVADLASVELKSRGCLRLRDYLASYADFRSLRVPPLGDEDAQGRFGRRRILRPQQSREFHGSQV